MFTNRQIQFFVNAYIDYATFIGFLIGLYGLKFNKAILPIVCLLWLTFLNDALLYDVDLVYILQDFHFYNPIQFLLLGWFFYQAFEDIKLKKIVPYILGIAVCFAVVNVIFLQPMTEYPSNFIILENSLLIIGATFLFIEKLDAPAKQNVFRDPVFIISVAILCFNIFSFIYFLLTNYFSKHKIDQFGSIYRILYFANIIYYALIVLAISFSLKKNMQVEKN
jgi:hypothetical protein